MLALEHTAAWPRSRAVKKTSDISEKADDQFLMRVASFSFPSADKLEGSISFIEDFVIFLWNFREDPSVPKFLCFFVCLFVPARGAAACSSRSSFSKYWSLET